jgi:hypothetical protein
MSRAQEDASRRKNDPFNRGSGTGKTLVTGRCRDVKSLCGAQGMLGIDEVVKPA